MLKNQTQQRRARSKKQPRASKPVHKPTKRNILTTRRKALKQQQQYESTQHKALTRRAFSNKSETDSSASGEQPFVTKQQYLQATAKMSQQDKEHYEKLKLKAQQQLTEGSQEFVDEDEVPLTAEELFYDMPPLSLDMFEFEPREQKGTLIWLPDCFESHDQHSRSFQMLMPKNLRVVIPNPPMRECTVLGGEEHKAWYDVMSVPFKADSCDMDYTGLKLSMYMIHQLIRDEAIRIGQKIAPFNASPEVVEAIGTERIFVGGFGQGAAIATFAALRYPKLLAGVVSHSGYIPFISQTSEAAKTLQDQLKQKYMSEHEALEAAGDEAGIKALAEKFRNGPGIAESAPNLKAPVYVLHNATDNVIPWCELAQPTFIQAIKSPLKCKLNLRMGKSDGHSIASLDLLDIQFWTSEIMGQKEREKLPQDMFERDTMVQLGEFGDSVIVVDKYSPHADRVSMPWTSPKILDHANIAQQDINRVKELIDMARKHPERVEEIAAEIDNLNNNADDNLWRAYLHEATYFVKHHKTYMAERRTLEEQRWQSEQSQAAYNESNTQQQQQQQQEQQDNNNDTTIRDSGDVNLGLFDQMYGSAKKD